MTLLEMALVFNDRRFCSRFLALFKHLCHDAGDHGRKVRVPASCLVDDIDYHADEASPPRDGFFGGILSRCRVLAFRVSKAR